MPWSLNNRKKQLSEFVKNNLNKLFAIFVILLLIGYQGIFKKDFDISCKNCNVVMIAITNVSAEHMGSYGYFRNTTPNIDEFAEKSILFENVFSHASWTLPTAVSVFTSKYPYSHNIMDRVRDQTIKEQTLSEILKSSGFRTAAFTGGGDYNKIYGLDKGFDTYIDSDYFVSLKNRMPLVFDWLDNNSKDKFFLFF